ncbi:hypothetical protein Ct61P_08490 [Colletotrichum tofieldiae]|nr:hypothetical protein Ct61P_08490 [Colletotrichum tofieldiae]
MTRYAAEFTPADAASGVKVWVVKGWRSRIRTRNRPPREGRRSKVEMGGAATGLAGSSARAAQEKMLTMGFAAPLGAWE